MYPFLIVLTRILCLYSRRTMDVNNNLTNLNLKVKCGLCEKSFFGEFLSKHIRISHPGVERPIKKKTQYLTDKKDLKFSCKFCKKSFALCSHARARSKFQCDGRFSTVLPRATNLAAAETL